MHQGLWSLRGSWSGNAALPRTSIYMRVTTTVPPCHRPLHIHGLLEAIQGVAHTWYRLPADAPSKALQQSAAACNNTRSLWWRRLCVPTFFTLKRRTHRRDYVRALTPTDRGLRVFASKPHLPRSYLVYLVYWLERFVETPHEERRGA